MSHQVFGTTPPPPPPMSAPFPSPGNRRRRRWPAIVAAAAAGALVSSALAGLVTTRAVDNESPSPVDAPTTVTVAAPAPAPPVPLPTAKANRQTCQVGFKGTDASTQAAADSLRQLPPGMKVLDPAVRTNPEWAAAVRRAGEFYKQAAAAQSAQIAPGTTPVLAEAAHTVVNALQLIGDAYVNFDPIAGNAYTIVVAAGDQMTELCTRLAP